jgi:hypothetical protein
VGERREETDGLGTSRGLAGVGERGSRGRVVGKWEVRHDGTTSLCILWTRGGSGGGVVDGRT